MDSGPEYFDLLRSKGIPLSQINPGSDESAIEGSEALHAIELLKDSQLPILGGDILSSDSGKLIYAYQLWGSEYHFLSWYCDKQKNESQGEYCARSYEVAKESIKRAVQVAQKLKRECFIVLII